MTSTSTNSDSPDKVPADPLAVRRYQVWAYLNQAQAIREYITDLERRLERQNYASESTIRQLRIELSMTQDDLKRAIDMIESLGGYWNPF